MQKTYLCSKNTLVVYYMTSESQILQENTNLSEICILHWHYTSQYYTQPPPCGTFGFDMPWREQRKHCTTVYSPYMDQFWAIYENWWQNIYSGNTFQLYIWQNRRLGRRLGLKFDSNSSHTTLPFLKGFLLVDGREN
jgi:hypothetical protein